MALSVGRKAPMDFGSGGHMDAPAEKGSGLMVMDPELGVRVPLEEAVARRPNAIYLDTLKQSINVFPAGRDRFVRALADLSHDNPYGLQPREPSSPARDAQTAAPRRRGGRKRRPHTSQSSMIAPQALVADSSIGRSSMEPSKLFERQHAPTSASQAEEREPRGGVGAAGERDQLPRQTASGGHAATLPSPDPRARARRANKSPERSGRGSLRADQAMEWPLGPSEASGARHGSLSAREPHRPQLGIAAHPAPLTARPSAAAVRLQPMHEKSSYTGRPQTHSLPREAALGGGASPGRGHARSSASRPLTVPSPTFASTAALSDENPPSLTSRAILRDAGKLAMPLPDYPSLPSSRQSSRPSTVRLPSQHARRPRFVAAPPPATVPESPTEPSRSPGPERGRTKRRSPAAPPADDASEGALNSTSLLRGLAKFGGAVDGNLPPAYGSRRFQRGVALLATGLPSDLSAAASVFLEGLEHLPEDEMLTRGFYQGTDRLKYMPKHRWARWPFSMAVEGATNDGIEPEEPPAPMGPVETLGVHVTSIEIGWQACELRPEVASDAVDGYHVDVAFLCPIEGQAAWRRAYKGRELRYTIKGLEVTRDVLVRVRAYNKKGPGVWGPVRQLRVAGVERPPPEEIKEIPPLWWTIELDDLIRAEKLEEGSERFVAVMEDLFTALHKHRSALKLAFRWYELVGGAVSRDGSDEGGQMTATQFLNFQKAIDAAENRNTPSSEADLIYQRSMRQNDRQGPSAAGAAVSGVPGAPTAWNKGRDVTKMLKVTNLFKKPVSNLMVQHQFVAGVVRIAYMRYPVLGTLPLRVSYFCEHFLEGHVREELDLLNDPYTRLMHKQPMLAALRIHKAPVERIFIYYATLDSSLGANSEAQKTTINLRELAMLVEDAEMYDSHFGPRNMFNAFARVNIEDDLYEQDDKANTSTELVLDEFFEVIARIYGSREWTKQDIAGKSGEGLEFARGFDAWMREYFFDRCHKGVKTRRTTGKRS